MTDIATLSGNERDPSKIAFVVRQLAERNALGPEDNSITTAKIADNAVTNTQLADMAQDIIKGRASGAGTGDPTDLTHTQVHDILRGLFGRERFLSLASTPVTLAATDAGKFILNYNANRTITLPTVATGLCFGIYTLDGGSGGSLTINFGGNLHFPDGSIVGTSIVLTSNQRMLIVSDGTNWVVFGSNFRVGIETGTWTPVLTFATPGNLSVAYTAQIGWYRKIHDLVTASLRIQTSSFTHTTASGAVRITGLPFTSVSASGQEFGVMRCQGITKANYTYFGLININASSFLEGRAMGSGQNIVTIDAADMPTGGAVLFNCVLSYLI